MKLARYHSVAVDLLIPCMTRSVNEDETYIYFSPENTEIKITLKQTGSTEIQTNDTEFYDYLIKELEKFSAIAAGNKRYSTIEGELFKIEYGDFINMHEIIFSKTN